jgi:WD40 repeat protein
MLWSGTAFNEFRVWRDRYPGGLTETEEAFAGAMVERAERQRRRRRRLTVAAFAVLVATVGAISTLWRIAEVERRQSEASKLLALGRMELDAFPSRALAYAIASLELTDDPESRRFALEALWRGPTAIAMRAPAGTVDFSPDGHLVAFGLNGRGWIDLWSSDGTGPVALRDTTVPPTYSFGYPRFDRTSAFVAGYFQPSSGPPVAGSVSIWSTESGEAVAQLPFEGVTLSYLDPFGGHLIAVNQAPGQVDEASLRVWRLDSGQPSRCGERLIRMGASNDALASTACLASVDPTGTWLAYAEDTDLYVVRLQSMESDRPRLVGHHEGRITDVAFHPDSERIAAVDDTGEIRLWPRAATSRHLVRSMKGRADGFGIFIDAQGTWIAKPFGDGVTQLWDLEGPPSQAPMELRCDRAHAAGAAFHPDGSWLVSANNGAPTFWPLSRRYPKVIRYGRGTGAPVFAPDGSWVATISDDSVRVWSLSPELEDRTLACGSESTFRWGLLVDPQMRFILYRDGEGMRRISLQNGSSEKLPIGVAPWSAALDASGRFLAAGYWDDDPQGRESLIDVLDLETGEMQVLQAGQGHVNDLQFAPDGRLLSTSGRKLRRWNLEDGTHELMLENVHEFDLSHDGRQHLTASNGRAVVHELEEGVSHELRSHGNLVGAVAFDPTGTRVITGDGRGAIRVGPVSGEEPILMLGHEGPIYTNPGVDFLAVDPTGRWIASRAEEDEARILLWPMPEGEPLLALPYDEFVARLKSLTNLRVVEREDSPTGFDIRLDAFPGWETVPSW